MVDDHEPNAGDLLVDGFNINIFLWDYESFLPAISIDLWPFTDFFNSKKPKFLRIFSELIWVLIPPDKNK